jgi:hypothetical protein
MFTSKFNSYQEINESVKGPYFEKQWYESIIHVLSLIQAGKLDPVQTHTKLLEICDGLQFVQENLNEKLGSQHRTLLKGIFSLSINIINGAIDTKNMQYLDIVKSAIRTVLEPYERLDPNKLVNY